MERLTKRNEIGIAVLRKPYMCDRCGEQLYRLADLGSGEPIAKLAEYEDLEERLQAVYGECDGLFKEVIEKVVEDLVEHEVVDLPEPVHKARLLTDGNVDRWEELKTLEEQGKLLKLPCVPGGAVWIIENEKISKFGVSTVTVQDGRVSFRNAVYICDLSDFGKTVFLTKEEAEAALKGERSE